MQCNEEFSRFVSHSGIQQGQGAIRQLQTLCHRLTGLNTCSQLDIHTLHAMQDKLRPYVESVDLDLRFDLDLLEHKVSVKKTSLESEGLFLADFVLEEFYEGKLTFGGSSIKALVTDVVKSQNEEATTKAPKEMNKEIKDFTHPARSNGPLRQETPSRLQQESRIDKNYRIMLQDKDGGTNGSRSFNVTSNVPQTTMVLTCPVQDHFNGTYSIRCMLPALCVFVNFTLMFVDFSAYTDANLGFNEPLRLPIYQQRFCVEGAELEVRRKPAGFKSWTETPEVDPSEIIHNSRKNPELSSCAAVSFSHRKPSKLFST